MRAIVILLLFVACGGSSPDVDIDGDPPLGTTSSTVPEPTTTSDGSTTDVDTSGSTTTTAAGDETGGAEGEAVFYIEACDDWMCGIYDAPDDADDRSCPIAPAAEWLGVVQAGLIGRHFEGPLPTAYAHYVTPATRQRMAILDLNDCSIDATADVPLENPAWPAYSGLVHGPDDREYPFMAPQFPFASSPWTSLCLYGGASVAGVAACGGAGFRESSVVPSQVGDFWTGLGQTDPVTVFTPLARGPNGFLYDLDGDGYDDIHLSWEFAIQSFSGQTGAQLLVTSYDVGRDVTPPGHVGFHSGRPFGGYTHFRDTLQNEYVLHVGGNGVGAFFWPCAVSRYVAMLTTTPGPPPTRSLWWSDYYGFFPLTDLALAPSIANLSRFHGCIHRIGDGIAYYGEAPFVVINWFESSGSIGLCPTCDNAEFEANLQYSTIGLWHTRWIQVDRAMIQDSAGWYTWGKSRNLLPDGAQYFVVENIGGQSPQDFTLVQPEVTMMVARITVTPAGTLSFDPFATFPESGRPQIAFTNPIEGPAGANYTGNVAELTVSDVDGDGLDDVQLTSGSWIGWSADANAFVAK